MSVRCLSGHEWGNFRQEIISAIRYGRIEGYTNNSPYWADGYKNVLSNLHETLTGIHSSFIATTATGVFVHFIGEAEFPSEIFHDSDEGRCRVYYNQDNFGRRYFWLEITGDHLRKRFYFTPPESLDQAALYGKASVLGEKDRLFRSLNVNIMLNGISRNLTLRLDQDWLNAARYG